MKMPPIVREFWKDLCHTVLTVLLITSVVGLIDLAIIAAAYFTVRLFK